MITEKASSYPSPGPPHPFLILPKKHSIRNDLLKKGATVGDSTVRYRLIRSLGAKLYPEESLAPDKLGRPVSDMPADELERRRFQAEQIKKHIGLSIEDPSVLVCGPEVTESMKRRKMLRDGGIVVSGKDGRTVIAGNYDGARLIRQQHHVHVPWFKKTIDVTLSTFMWIGLYGGFEPRSVFGNLIYQRRLKKAVAGRIAGHKKA